MNKFILWSLGSLVMAAFGAAFLLYLSPIKYVWCGNTKGVRGQQTSILAPEVFAIRNGSAATYAFVSFSILK